MKAGHHPVPFAYTLILQRTVYLFCTLLPFAGRRSALHDAVCLGLYLHLFIVGFAGGRAGRSFGTAANDLPLNAMCNTIERNLLDMTGQHPLPETLSGPLLQSDLSTAHRAVSLPGHHFP
ncbi:bestrophin family ion channel [Klebsiella pneumoniae]|uniref:bestrophin family ion channel n=1 Tax=Klebsiella pneumoniae TaxID=573 RepID=UPI001E3F67E4|nr:bestrophin family ion channel [Klebsiella pneumoniae]